MAAHVGADSVALEHLGRDPQIFDAAVGARTDIDLVHRCSCHFPTGRTFSGLYPTVVNGSNAERHDR